MIVHVKVKQAGRRRALLERVPLAIDDVGARPRLGELLDAIVAAQVAAYNAKTAGESLLPFLSPAAIDAAAATGKIGFGTIYHEDEAALDAARETARTAFTDGLFAVFAGETEIKSLDEPVALDDDTVITFIRLTFLAGSYW